MSKLFVSLLPIFLCFHFGLSSVIPKSATGNRSPRTYTEPLSSNIEEDDVDNAVRVEVGPPVYVPSSVPLAKQIQNEESIRHEINRLRPDTDAERFIPSGGRRRRRGRTFGLISGVINQTLRGWRRYLDAIFPSETDLDRGGGGRGRSRPISPIKQQRDIEYYPSRMGQGQRAVYTGIGSNLLRFGQDMMRNVIALKRLPFQMLQQQQRGTPGRDFSKYGSCQYRPCRSVEHAADTFIRRGFLAS